MGVLTGIQPQKLPDAAHMTSLKGLSRGRESIPRLHHSTCPILFYYFVILSNSIIGFSVVCIEAVCLQCLLPQSRIKPISCVNKDEDLPRIYSNFRSQGSWFNPLAFSAVYRSTVRYLQRYLFTPLSVYLYPYFLNYSVIFLFSTVTLYLSHYVCIYTLSRYLPVIS